MHPIRILALALASLTSARTFKPRGLAPRDFTLPDTPAGGLPATAKPAVASVLGDTTSTDGQVGAQNWTGACTQAIRDSCSPSNLGALDQWVWSQNTNNPTCMVGFWQPSPTPKDPNVPKGVEPLTQDKCKLYFTQMQTTLQAIIQKNPTVDRGSVNIVNFPNNAQGDAYTAGSQVDSTRPSFIMQPLNTVPMGDLSSDSQGSASGGGVSGGQGAQEGQQYGVSCDPDHPECGLNAVCDQNSGDLRYTGPSADNCGGYCRCAPTNLL